MNFSDLAMWQQLSILIVALILVIYLRALPYIYEKKKDQKSEKKNADE